MMKTLATLLTFLFLFVSVKAQLTYQWSCAAGSSTGADYGQAIATDASGNVYVTGMFTGTVDFDPGVGTFNLSSLSGSQDIFLAKYDANGSFIFANQIAGTNDEKPFDIYVDANNVYVVGIFKGTVDFNPGVGVNNITFNGGGTDGDGFCAKYDLSGNYVWTFRIGGSGNDRMLGVTVDGTGNVFICGFTSMTVDMDPGVGTVNFTSALYNSFFGKYTSAGAYVFAKQLVGDYNETSDIQLDATGNIYIAGDWSQSIDFDPGVGTVTMTTSSGTQIDAFFAKYTSLGIYTWAKRIGGIGVDYSMQIAMDANYVFVGGLFSNTCDFDPNVSVVNLISAGGSDLFYARYDLTGAYQYAYGIGGTANDYLNGMHLDASSNIFITGKFTGTNIDFNPGVGSAPLTGTSTGYIGEYDVNGNYVTASSTGSSASEGKGIHVTASSVYFTGLFQGTVDFDFGVGVGNETSNGGDDVFFARYNVCVGSPPLQPGTISGPITICNGSTNTYSISPVVGATSYTWVLPGGWSGTSTTTSIIATASATSGNISVTANNACGSSTAQTLAVTVNPIPIVNAGTNQSVCASISCIVLNGTSSTGSGIWTTSGTGTFTPNNTTLNASYCFSPADIAAGTVTLTLTSTNNGACNPATNSIIVTINALPTVTMSAANTTTCVNWTTDLLTGTPVGGTFSGTGVTGSNFDPSVAGVGTWTVTYTYTDGNGCTNTATTNITVGLCTGVNEIGNENIIIYPNPFSSTLTVIASATKQSHLTVTNVLGEIIFETETQNKKTEIDLSKLQSGVYFIKIVDDDGTITKKIIKE